MTMYICGRNRDYEKVQVGKDQEKAQSEKDSHFKNQGGKMLLVVFVFCLILE